jgi:uncharacterized membrane protein YhfC
MLYVTYTLNLLLMMGLPILLAALLARRSASRWPLVRFATTMGLVDRLREEVARYVVLRFWRKRDRSWRAALMFGAGYGGAETVIFGVLVLAATGAINMFIRSNVDPAQLGLSPAQLPAFQTVLDTFWGVPVLYPLLGAFDRVLTLTTLVFLAVPVMQAFTRGNRPWLAAATCWHVLTSAVAFYVFSTWGEASGVGAVAVLALVGLAGLLALRQPEPLPVALAAMPAPAAANQLDRAR